MPKRRRLTPEEMRRLKPGPILHRTLPDDMKRAIKFIREVFKLTYKRSQREWELGFMRDRDPGLEVSLWMRMALGYLKYFETHAETEEEARDVFAVLLERSMTENPFEIYASLKETGVVSLPLVSEVCACYYIAEDEDIPVEGRED